MENKIININIGEPEKLPYVLTNKSAYISFSYDSNIIKYLTRLPNAFYHPDTREWEIPLSLVTKFKRHFDEYEYIGNYVEDDIKKENTLIPNNYSFKLKPYDYQLEGINYILNKKKCLLGDVQGLGKTKQVIETINILIQQKKIKRGLIICGVNSLKYNWQEEIEQHSNLKSWVLGTRYSKKGKMKEGTADDRLYDLDNLEKIDADIIITNIETMRLKAYKKGNKYVFPFADKLNEGISLGKFGLIAFDECHKCKDTTSKQGRALLKVTDNYMIAMSGTPLMNNPIDLYFILYWLGYEDHSLYQFKMHYCVMGGYRNTEILGYKNQDQLRKMITDIMIRRLKEEVLELPEKIQINEYVDMNKEQEKLYLEVLEGTKNELHKIPFMRDPLSVLIRLRQATGNPNLLVEGNVKSNKLIRMMELVEDIIQSNEKVIIFSNWKQSIDIATNLLSNFNPLVITGDTDSEDRIAIKNDFQNDENRKVILGTIGAMGTGLTLNKASNVIFIDEPWNKALKDQAEDRAHRIGTQKAVNVITLITKNTIDEKIHDIVYRKGVLANSLVDGKVTKVDAALIGKLLEH